MDHLRVGPVNDKNMVGGRLVEGTEFHRSSGGATGSPRQEFPLQFLSPISKPRHLETRLSFKLEFRGRTRHLHRGLKENPVVICMLSLSANGLSSIVDVASAVTPLRR